MDHRRAHSRAGGSTHRGLQRVRRKCGRRCRRSEVRQRPHRSSTWLLRPRARAVRRRRRCAGVSRSPPASNLSSTTAAGGSVCRRSEWPGSDSGAPCGSSAARASSVSRDIGLSPSPGYRSGLTGNTAGARGRWRVRAEPLLRRANSSAVIQRHPASRCSSKPMTTSSCSSTTRLTTSSSLVASHTSASPSAGRWPADASCIADIRPSSRICVKAVRSISRAAYSRRADAS